jgi:pseudouridine synthase
VKALSERKARIILREGKNRQVRKVFGKVGCEVVSLKRVRVKNLELGNLAVGKFRELTKNEIEDLRK